jgi:hypothetical protein
MSDLSVVTSPPSTDTRQVELTPTPVEGVNRQVGRLDNGWRISVALEAIDGRPTVTSITLSHPAGHPCALTTKVWREVPVGVVVDAALANVADCADGRAKDARRLLARSIRSWTKLPGRRGHPDDLYAGVGALYLQILSTGSRRPIRELAEAMGTTPATASHRVRVARRRGLLTSDPHAIEADALLDLG